ncbi:MAG: formylglycine-generating enzyme family protein [Proteobacteria bacterium]|nr:formylglycine-generating enzyme family protein [Pseudomonadota bacterium]
MSHSQAADRRMITVGAGDYIAGSTPEEREQAYDDYRATAGHDGARRFQWFEREEDRHVAHLDRYRIDQTPVTNVAYAEFVRDTGIEPPFIDRAMWMKQRFIQDYDTQVLRYNWRSESPPRGREDHPVVLVTWREADAYCRWRGVAVGEKRRLPTTAEYEKAARGKKGSIYPWGHEFDASKLNSQVGGPLDTVAVGSFPDGASAYSMLDAAGNVFQWTSTPWPHRKTAMTVKGSAWDDYAGVGRGASMHGRRAWVRHVLVGFRCAASGN